VALPEVSRALAQHHEDRMSETTIMFAVRQALANEPDVLIFRNNVGFDRERRVKYGLALGSSDLVGVLTVREVGVALFVEVKTPIGRMSDDQKRFREVVLKRGAVHIIARDVDNTMAALTEARSLILHRLGVLS